MGTDKLEYTLIRSDRRTVSLAVTPEGLVVRAPLRLPKHAVDEFVESRRDWIATHTARMEARQKELSSIEPLTEPELRALAEEALKVIPERAAHYAPLVGVRCNRITVRAQRTRWGSCSSRGNLNFNCLLMLTPPEVLDSVVVHELCHLKELNHSPRFYAEVLRVFPEYYRWNDWLKKNGDALMKRLP